MLLRGGNKSNPRELVTDTRAVFSMVSTNFQTAVSSELTDTEGVSCTLTETYHRLRISTDPIYPR